MAPGASHELRAVGDGGAILNVAFPAETWQRLAGERGSVTRARISSSSRNLLASLVADFIAQPATALRRDALILGILARCEEGDQADPMPPWLQDALDALDVDDLATGVPALIARCARSREHVARVCREFLSKSPTELINDRRLAAVEHDLAMGDEAVGEIAERYGFGNRAHFHQRFKERFGLSPAAWRRRHKASVL
jgi:AraC-like DNA-binding protein